MPLSLPKHVWAVVVAPRTGRKRALSRMTLSLHMCAMVFMPLPQPPSVSIKSCCPSQEMGFPVPQFPSVWCRGRQEGSERPHGPSKDQKPSKSREIPPRVIDSRLSSLSSAELPAFPREAAGPAMGQGVLELPPPTAALRCHPEPKNPKQRECLCSLPGPNLWH